MRTTTRRYHRALAATAIVLAAALSGCGGDDDKADDRAVGGTIDTPMGEGFAGDLSDAAEEFGIPEECFTTFPGTFGEPDIANVDLMPAGWPEPVDDAELCGTSSTNSEQNANYLSSAAPTEVLDAFEAALTDAGYEVSREDPSGLGRDMLAGSTGDGPYFQVVGQEGGFTVTFARA